VCGSALKCVGVRCWSVLECVAEPQKITLRPYRGDAVCCSVLQCVELCCSVLQYAAVYFPLGPMRELQHVSVLQCVAVCCSVLQCVSILLRCVALCCRVLRCVAVRSSVLQCVAA